MARYNSDDDDDNDNDEIITDDITNVKFRIPSRYLSKARFLYLRSHQRSFSHSIRFDYGLMNLCLIPN